ncbi:hypothetical protein VTI74DRAFT_5787 [Chaetomium olivicolor]
MTGSWPTPGTSQPSYSYGSSNSATPGPSPLAQAPYSRGPTAYGSAPSPSHQHFSGRASSSAANTNSLPTPQPYQDQPGFSSSGGVGTVGGAGGLGSPLSPQGQGGNQQTGLALPILGAARQGTTGQSTPGGPDTVQEGSSYRHPPTPTSYYPPASAAQQSFPSYASPVTQPSPAAASPATSGSIPRGPSSIPAMAPPLQFTGGRSHQIPSMASYASYSPVPGPVLSNMHHPGAPLAMVGGVAGIQSYNHAGLSGHHPHHLYVHHTGGPSPQSERPFKCNGCQQAFNRNHDLKRHQRIHLEIKPFACEDCEKRFSRKDALKRHRLVKGCGGGTSSQDAAKKAVGGNTGFSLDRSGTGGGDQQGSPRTAKKEV